MSSRTRTVFALGLAATLAAGGSTALAAQSAQAYGPTSHDLHCRLYFGDTGTGDSSSTYSDTFTLTQTPSHAPVGTKVTVKLSGAKGPRGGPVAVDKGTNIMVATLALSGAQTGTVVAKSSGAYPAADVAGHTAPSPYFLGKYTTTGSYTVTKAGSTTVALKLLKVDNQTTYNVDTYCADAADSDFKASGGAVSATMKQVTVNGDSVKPVATVSKPASKASKVKSISGTVKDVGAGPKSVTARVTEKISGKWYAFNGKKLVKKSSKAKALKAAKKLTDTSVSSGRWSVKVKKLKKGTLYVTYTATDKVNNTSKAKTYSKKLK